MEGIDPFNQPPMEGPSEGMRGMYEKKEGEKSPDDVLTEAATFLTEHTTLIGNPELLTRAKRLLNILDVHFDSGRITDPESRAQAMDTMTGLRELIRKTGEE